MFEWSNVTSYGTGFATAEEARADADRHHAIMGYVRPVEITYRPVIVPVVSAIEEFSIVRDGREEREKADDYRRQVRFDRDNG